MLLRNLDLLRYDPLGFLRQLVLVSVAIVVAITVHEFSHALAADRLGDPTPRSRGRLSLNPLAHLDPAGTLFLFLVGFGWGKPVPVNPGFLRGGRRAMGTVAFAGPMAGLVTAAVAAYLLRAMGWWQVELLLLIVLFNILLALFNLIPLPPLDGFQVAVGFLPRSVAQPLSRLEYYGIMPLVLLLFLDMFLGFGLLWRLIRPGVNFFSSLLLGGPLL